MTVGYYMGPGPAALPKSVLAAFDEQRIQVGSADLRFYELSHRHPLSVRRQSDLIARLRNMLCIPDDYHILMMPGGARHQYEQHVLNFRSRAQFKILQTGHWSRMWAEMLTNHCPDITTVQSVDLKKPILSTGIDHSDGEMLLTVLNETVDGMMMPHTTLSSHPCVVADVTSWMGFQTLPVQDFHMVFAQVGKAFGVSGVTLLVMHPDLLDQAAQTLLPLQSYRMLAQNQSVQVTPSLICLDMMWHMLDWMESMGGVDQIEIRQRSRADAVYAMIEQNPLYRLDVPAAHRSCQNICFFLKDGSESVFLDLAEKHGLYGLKGHKAVGGIRINLYHGIDDDAINRLLVFLEQYGGSNYGS